MPGIDMNAFETHADKRLVERMLAGDDVAFRQFFSTYFPRLLRFALYRLHGDEALAEDVAQSTLGKAMDKLDSYRGEAALYSWLCTFCRHEIGAAIKRTRREPVDLIDDLPLIRATLETLMDPAAGPDQDANRFELSRLIQVTMDSLPSAYADALEWKYIDGLSVAEIGERMGRGRKAAESLLNRARESFRDGFSTLAGAGIDQLLDQRQ
jgi:RNA polymerase sigma-70 factor (ECF subfamily)